MFSRPRQEPGDHRDFAFAPLRQFIEECGQRNPPAGCRNIAHCVVVRPRLGSRSVRNWCRTRCYARSDGPTESRAAKVPSPHRFLIITNQELYKSEVVQAERRVMQPGTGDHSNILRVHSPTQIATARLFASACPLRSEILVYSQFEQRQDARRAERKKIRKIDLPVGH
jgi:hypothetical protein